jgi:hypothetical protein
MDEGNRLGKPKSHSLWPRSLRDITRRGDLLSVAGQVENEVQTNLKLSPAAFLVFTAIPFLGVFDIQFLAQLPLQTQGNS